MDEFDRAKVFSSIDSQGRYAYQNQPRIAHWNMAMLAQTLLPLLNNDEDAAIALAQTAVDRFPALYATNYTQLMRDKVGLFDDAQDGDIELIDELLDLMHTDSVDFTAGFRTLSQAMHEPASFIGLFNDGSGIDDWIKRWSQRIDEAHDSARMLRINPAVIPRNHWIEATIERAVAGDWSLFFEFEKALASPFEEHNDFSTPPDVQQRVSATFCGT